MDGKLQALYTREKELKEDEESIMNILKLVREEMHKMQVEQMQWESMDMAVSEVDNLEDCASLSPKSPPMDDNEVNAQEVNLEVPKLNELFMYDNKIVLTKKEEEEEESEDADDPESENENSDEDELSVS